MRMRDSAWRPNHDLYCDASIEEVRIWTTITNLSNPAGIRINAPAGQEALTRLADIYSDRRLDTLIEKVRADHAGFQAKLAERLDRQERDCGTRLSRFPRGCSSGRANARQWNLYLCPEYSASIE